MELGSEYNLTLEDLTIKDDNIFKYLRPFERQCYFDSGRSALRHFISFFQDADEFLMPEFICRSVTDCFQRDKIRFYKLNHDFSADLESLGSMINGHTRVLFLMHYFGAVRPRDELLRIREFADDNGLIIVEDTTHSIFSESCTIGDYQVCSIRKWIPVPSGGVLYSGEDPMRMFDRIDHERSTDNSRTYGMVLKDLFLKTGFDCNEEYRKIFRECEDRLDKQKDIYLLSDLSRYIASCVDVKALKRSRVRNYDLLKTELGKRGIEPVVKLREDDCPLVFPIKVNDRDDLRSFLMDNRIYCAVHWPFDGEKRNERCFAAECAEKLISLPVDQRYDEKDIIYLVETMDKYGENKKC